MSEFLDLKTIAASFGVHPRTLRRLWEKDEFPKPIRLGKRIIWRKELIELFIAQKENQ